MSNAVTPIIHPSNVKMASLVKEGVPMTPDQMEGTVKEKVIKIINRIETP